jgi:predicted site-specific integrase-resolvase
MNEQEEKAPQQELVEDLLSIVTSFAGRLYGMRSNKAKKVVEAVRHAIR